MAPARASLPQSGTRAQATSPFHKIVGQVSSQNISPINRPRNSPHENPIQNIFAWDIGLGGIGIPLSLIIPSTASND